MDELKAGIDECTGQDRVVLESACDVVGQVPVLRGVLPRSSASQEATVQYVAHGTGLAEASIQGQADEGSNQHTKEMGRAAAIIRLIDCSIEDLERDPRGL